VPRHITAAILCGAILLQSLGWLPAGLAIGLQYFTTGQFFQAENDTPTILTLSQADFEQYRINQREIRIGQHLYDIESQTPFDDSIRLEVWHDHLEQHLQQTITQMVQSGTDDSSDTTAPLTIWVLKGMQMAFLVPAPPTLPVPLGIIPTPAAFFWQDTYSVISLPVPERPPQS
jgi:hypothetical protein